MAATETFANNPSTTVVSGGTDAPVSGTTEVWTVASNFGWPTASTGSTQFHVGDPAAPSEVILVTNMSGTSWNVTRGAESSVPVAHAAGFTIAQVVTAGWLASVSFLNPMTTAGDMVAGTVSGLGIRVPGNTTSAKEFLTSTGTGSAANAPAWGTIATGDVPVLNQNTTGTSANVSGTVATIHGGTGLGSVAAYSVVTGGTSSTSPLQTVAGTAVSGYVLTGSGAGTLPTWQPATGGSSVTFPITVLEGGTGGTTAALAITNLGAADLTSAQTLTTKTLKNTSLTFSQLGTVSTSQSVSCANGNVQELTLGASVAVSAISGPGGTVACDLTLYIVQAASGGPYSITSWPASLTWLGGGAPTIQTGAGAVTVVTMESLNGGTAWYGAQITGAPSLPISIALGGTGATDSNDALAALAGEGVLGIFGNGNDGVAVFDGSSTVLGLVPSGGTYTLTRDILCTGITVDNSAAVRTSSASGTYRMFCQGTVTINSGGTITADGNAASGAVAGAVLASGSLVGGRAGGAGGVAGTGNGGNGGNANLGVAGGAGGAGGGGGVGGTAGTVTESGANVVTNVFNNPFPLLTGICAYGGFTLQIGYGAGGGGGGGATSNAGGGGGGGGGIVPIFAYNVINNGTLTAVGGAGGNGAGGNAGGGGGGAGGLVIAYTLSGWTAGTTATTGGAGGTHSGSGTDGAAGGTGNTLNVVLTS